MVMSVASFFGPPCTCSYQLRSDKLQSNRPSRDVFPSCFREVSSLPFCSLSILSPRVATPWTYFLHLSLSSVILIDFSTGSPVHVLILSIRPFVVFLACVHLALFFLQANSLVSSWCDHSMLASLL